MKNLFKIFVLIAVLFTAVTETADAQNRRGRTTTTFQDNQQNNQQNTQSQAFDESFDFKKANPNGNCVTAYLATNQASMNFNEPETIWGSHVMTINGNALEGETKAVSSRNSVQIGNTLQYFDKNQSMGSHIVINKQGDDVQIKLNNNVVNVLGVVSGTKGDVFYGTYGDNGKYFATISLIRTPCPQ